MERDIAKALRVLSDISSRHPELKLEADLEDGDLSKIYMEAIRKADAQRKRREKETGLFRVRWGHSASGETFLYRLEDYEAVADRLEEEGDFPRELVIEEGA